MRRPYNAVILQAGVVKKRGLALSGTWEDTNSTGELLSDVVGDHQGSVPGDLAKLQQIGGNEREGNLSLSGEETSPGELRG